MPRGTPKTEGKSQHQRRTASRVYTHTHTTEASFAQLSRPRDPRLICAHRRSVKARGSRGTGCVCVAWGRAVYPPRPSRALGEGRIKVAETRALWGREHIARVRRNASLSIALHCPRPISPIGEIQGRSLRSGRFNNCETLPPPPPGTQPSQIGLPRACSHSNGPFGGTKTTPPRLHVTRRRKSHDSGDEPPHFGRKTADNERRTVLRTKKERTVLSCPPRVDTWAPSVLGDPPACVAPPPSQKGNGGALR